MAAANPTSSVSLRGPAHGSTKLPWATLSLTLLGVLIFFGFEAPASSLLYDRQAILEGDIWRLASSHLVHLDAQHLLYNMGALAALGWLYETSSFGGPKRLLIWVLVPAALAVSIFLVLVSPQTLFYCGLSAALNALFAVAVIDVWRQNGQRSWLLLLLLLDLGKILWEAAVGPIFSSGLPWPPHGGAHLVGLSWGVLYGFVDWRLAQKTNGLAWQGTSLRLKSTGAYARHRSRS